MTVATQNLKFRAFFSFGFQVGLLVILMGIFGCTSEQSTVEKGIRLMNEGKVYEAIDYYTDQIDQNPDNEIWYFFRGESYQLICSHEKAITDFNMSDSLSEPQPWTLFSRAISYDIQGDFHRARLEIERYINLFGEDPSSILASINLYTREGRYDEAKRMSLEGLAKYPNDPSLLNVYGYALMSSGDYLNAERLFLQALNWGADLPYVHNNLAYCQFKLGKVSSAKKHINESMRLDKGNSLLWRNHALIYLSSGEEALACQAYRRAKELGYEKCYQQDGYAEEDEVFSVCLD